MKKLICLCGLMVVGLAASAQEPVPPAATPAEVAAGTDRYKIVTPYGLAQAGISGATGGYVSNQVIAAVVANYYTNNPYQLRQVNVRLGANTIGTLQVAITNADNTRLWVGQWEQLSVGATSNTITFSVPPGAWYKFSGNTAVISDGEQHLIYYSTNGAVVYATTAGNALSVNASTGVVTGTLSVGYLDIGAGNGGGLTNVHGTNVTGPFIATNGLQSAGAFPLIVTLAPDAAANQSYTLDVTNSGVDNLGYAKLINGNNGYYIEFNSASLAGSGLEPNWALFDASDTMLSYAGTMEGIWGDAAVGGLPYNKTTLTRTLALSAAQYQIPALITNAAVYVATNGNDATGIRGLKDFPFRTLPAANAAARSGDTWFFAPGFYDVQGLWIPTNAVVVAPGAVLRFNSPSAAISPIGSILFSGGVFSNSHHAGTLVGLDNTTKFQAYNTIFHGSTDTLTHAVPENFDGEFVGCTLSSWWDIITTSANTRTNAQIKFIGCQFYTWFIPKPTIPVPNTGSTINVASGFTNVIFDGCYIKIGEGFTGNVAGITDGNSQVKVSATIIELPASALGTKIQVGKSGTGSITVDTSYPLMSGTVALRAHANASTFSGIASTAIAATGWTNIWSTNSAVVTFGGTTVSSWKKRSGALTATNVTYPVFSGNQTIILHPGQAVVISGTGVSGTADPLD